MKVPHPQALATRAKHFYSTHVRGGPSPHVSEQRQVWSLHVDQVRGGPSPHVCEQRQVWSLHVDHVRGGHHPMCVSNVKFDPYM